MAEGHGSGAAGLLAGKVAVVTGAGGGIGRGVARRMVREGAHVVVAEINAKGGINGKQVELKIMDDQCKPEVATNVATKLVSEGVNLVIGHICSGATKAALGIYKDAKVIAISPSATNPPLTKSLRSQLENTVKSARDVAEKAAGAGIQPIAGMQLGVVFEAPDPIKPQGFRAPPQRFDAVGEDHLVAV